jgi:hypothetical protein
VCGAHSTVWRVNDSEVLDAHRQELGARAAYVVGPLVVELWVSDLRRGGTPAGSVR